MLHGRWYKASNHPGVFVSALKCSVIDPTILDSYKDRVDAIGTHDKGLHEAEALVYLMAYDLTQFRMGFVLGADHPRIEWSPRATARPSKGPDGFDTKKPLSTIGVVPPYYEQRTEATFVGGFKREHGCFKAGPLSTVNNYSHFGFMEEGTVFSALHPGLATVCIFQDGTVDLLTWPDKSDELQGRLLHARQNCVALVDGVDANGMSVPGKYVNRWGDGAWSGNQHGDILTLRAGMAIQDAAKRRFLVFAYFTGATPSSMARIFQAFNCRYGMLLDMNSPGLCYTALYKRDSQCAITGAEYLHKDMAGANGSNGSLRFLQTNDVRDFFYMMRAS
jgi:hypothetical protein